MNKPLAFERIKGAPLLFVLAILLAACGGGHPEPEGKRVVETPIEGGFSNAALIRNPVTLNAAEGQGQIAVLSFSDTLFDFGQVREGITVEHTFAFVNTGDSPLLISRAYSTCGCTVPEWPETPVLPGEGGVITVRFDTEGRPGPQIKPVTITANTLPASTKVYIKGEVLPSGKEPK